MNIMLILFMSELNVLNSTDLNNLYPVTLKPVKVKTNHVHVVRSRVKQSIQTYNTVVKAIQFTDNYEFLT